MTTASDRGELSLFFHRVRDLVRRPPVTCGPTASAADIARLLSRERVGSAIVVDAASAPIGIVTDRDLRRKVVAERRDAAATPATEIMSAPVATARPGAFAFEAMLEMTRREIHHLAVVEDGRLVGVLSSHDFFLLQTTHPVSLAREIGRALSLDALAELATRVTALARRLVDEGGSAHDIGQIVAELNDRMAIRVLGLTAGTLEDAGAGPPPVPSCWLLFGSEARREQTLRTDQDNGLVYADPSPELGPTAAAYYARYAGEAIQGLIRVGFPPCPGEAMASTPRWCQPVSVWAEYFRRWIREARPDHVLDACIHFDLRPLVGASELAAQLTDVVRHEAPTARSFLRLLAHNVVSRRLPLTMFGNVAVLRSGPRRGTVDVKAAGSVQLVGAARLAALELGVAETNTVERFQAAAARGLCAGREAREIIDAHQLLMRIRLVHQLDELAAGQPLDDHIDPARLSHADALLFKDALKTVSRVQAQIRERYATDLVPG